ncbi:MAG: hypothetical protein U1D96_00480 [Eubacteriales bacterium]|nr:hypothetical protein [Bacillota bacterium]MBV1727322.1 hypothetical protein [Desulforudis sp.]MDP3051388.1 hypothetical protein [Eubacteriales bacterium]MDQ7788515.1 hypothetical protein [Clostridia bacterium]MBU4533453.1 hypothetical protein [Bacillota bacterium]
MSGVWRRVAVIGILMLTVTVAGCGYHSAQKTLVQDYIQAVATGDWERAYESAYLGGIPGMYPNLDGYVMAVKTIGLDELFRSRVSLKRVVIRSHQVDVPVFFKLPDGREFEGNFILDDRMGYWTLRSGFPEIRGKEPNGVTGQGYGQFWHIEVSYHIRPWAENRRLSELGTVYRISSLEGSILSYSWRGTSVLSSASGQFTADGAVKVLEPIRSDQADVSFRRLTFVDLRKALASTEVTIAWRGYDGIERYEQLKLDPGSFREGYIKPISGW